MRILATINSPTKIPHPTYSRRPHRSTGLSTPFNHYDNVLSPLGSSASASDAISIASNSSESSAATPPMTKEDVKIVFSNIADLALFSDLFTEKLEDALGSVLSDGAGQDSVGALFLEMVRNFRVRL